MSDTEKEIELIKKKLELMERLLEVEKELKEVTKPVIPYQPVQPIIIPPVTVPAPCIPQPCPKRRTTGPIWIVDPTPTFLEPIVTCGTDTVSYE